MPFDVEIRAHSDSDKAREALAGKLSFGEKFADLMFIARHSQERGWHDAEITNYGPISLLPGSKALHYGQEIFEGMKAYRWADGRVALFRPESNCERMNRSARRLCMAEIPVEFQMQALDLLTDMLREWVPSLPGSSLYIRPTLIGTDPSLGVAPSRTHLYFIICSPVGPYFPRGFEPISVFVEENRVRAVRGGIGEAKTGGNYAAGLLAQEQSIAAGYDQVLWLDGIEHRYLEELNAMNVFVVEENALITPPLEGTILPGVTRQSILELASEEGLFPVERPISIDQLISGIESGYVTEFLAAGTAAVVTPIASVGYKGRRYPVGHGAVGPVAKRLYDAITGIQYGKREDTRGWVRVVEPAHGRESAR